MLECHYCLANCTIVFATTTMAPSRALFSLAKASRSNITSACSLPRIERFQGLNFHRSRLRVLCNRSFTTSRILYEEPGSDPQPPDYLSEGELKVFNKIKSELQPTSLEVQDISGGCGSMYGLEIVSEKFKGLSVIKQHRLVNEVLGEEIKKWHGVQLKTRAE